MSDKANPLSEERCPVCLSDSRKYGNMRPCGNEWHTEAEVERLRALPANSEPERAGCDCSCHWHGGRPILGGCVQCPDTCKMKPRFPAAQPSPTPPSPVAPAPVCPICLRQPHIGECETAHYIRKAAEPQCPSTVDWGGVKKGARCTKPSGHDSKHKYELNPEAQPTGESALLDGELSIGDAATSWMNRAQAAEARVRELEQERDELRLQQQRWDVSCIYREMPGKRRKSRRRTPEKEGK